MQLSERRRAGVLSQIALFGCLFVLFAQTAHAAVLGIDFGTTNIKAALVKPGIPIDIVLTKDSKRKETAALAFKPNRDSKGKIVTAANTFPERAYGSDALALQGRFPSEVFPNLKLLLGLQNDEEGAKTLSTYKERYPALQAEQVKELGTTVFKSTAFPEDVFPFSVEELVGMELASIKRNAQIMAGKGTLVDDVVITIPPFYTADERRAVAKAANFAGFNVMSLISDGLAVGLDYAKTRTFPEVTKGESPEHHIVFDMGAGSTSATVLRFQSKTVKDIGRFNKTVQEVAVQGVGYDRTLGGDALNHVILDDIVAKLAEKSGTAREQIKSNGRVMARLYKESERARQVLSANTDVNIGLEEILPDVDFRTKLTRAEFEQQAADFSARVGVPVKEALRMAKLSIKDINSIILYGGALRTPFVKAKLESLVDDPAKLRSSVNPDESAVFGAAFKAAQLSPSFKVKEIRDSDIAVYATGLTYVDSGKPRMKPLFDSTSPIGSGATTKQVSFKDKENFSFGFVQNVAGVDRPLLRVNAENLTESVDELKRRAGCSKDDISTKFSVKLAPHHGLPDVIAGDVSCETEETIKTGSVGDSVKGWLGLGKKKDQEPLGEGVQDDGPVEQVEATPASAAGSSDTASTASGSACETPTKRIEIIPLRWSTTPEGLPQPDAAQLSRTTERLKAFDESDKARSQRDEAQNVLESFTYQVRDFLENKDMIAASTDAEREQLSARLQSVKDWMEASDLTKETTATLKEKLRELKSLVDPIKTRRSEGISRPGLVSALQKNLDDTQKLILKTESVIEKAKASTASPSAASTTTAPSSDADKLEEPDTSAAAPSPSSEPNPLINLDLTAIKKTHEDISKWLVEKVAEQKKLKPNDNPVLLVRDLQKRSAEMKRAMDDLSIQVKILTKPKPKPKPKPSPKPKASKKADKAEADEPVPADTPVEAPEGSGSDVPPEPEPARNPKGKGKPVKGDESIEDMLKWTEKAKHDHEHERDEL